MKTTKQLLCLLLAVVLFVSLALTGCKKPATTEPPATDPTQGSTDKPAETPLPPASLATAEQMKNVVLEKTSSAGGSITAHPGGRITYKLLITNNNADAISVNVTDTLPQGTKLVNGCDKVSGSELSWTVDRIEPGKTYAVTYNVSPDYTIKQVRESKTDIILKNTEAQVMGVTVPAPAKDIYVLETFNATDIRRIEMGIDAMVTANLSATDGNLQKVNRIALAGWMYYIGFTKGLGMPENPDEILTQIFEKAGENASGGSTGSGEEIGVEATNLLRRVAPHLYGGTQIPASNDSQFRGARATQVTINDLISGDLIIANKGGQTKVYIVDGSKLVYLGQTEVIRCIDPATVLPDLTSSDKYVVIRPSINYNVTFSLQEGEYFNDADKEGYTDLEKALIATAEAYLLRGDRTQYTDDMTGTAANRAESAIKQPEDYTVDQYGYTNCAYFTYDVHWATYGVAAKATSGGKLVNLNTTANISSAAALGWDANTLTGTNASTVFFYAPPTKLEGGNKVSTLTDTEKEALKQQICSLLRPGDVINIRRTTGSGHAMLYVGNGMIIHSTGGNYKSANKTDTHEASIRFRMVEDLFNPDVYNLTSCVYNLETFAIVRPQNLTNATVTENTANRVANMQGVIAEKVSSTAMGKTVSCGDTITYTFYIFNTNAEAKQFTIKDTLSQHVTFVSATDGGTCSGNNISWQMTVPADTRVEFSYTVKVNDGVAAYTAIDGSKATINGVVHKCIDTYVANTLSADQQQKLVEAVNTVKGMDVKGLSGVQVANLIYKTAFGIDNIFGENVTTDAQLFNGDGKNNIGIFNDTTAYSKDIYVSMMDSNTSNAAKMVAPGMFGGLNVYNSTTAGEQYTRYLNVGERVLRSRYFWEKDLVIGDIFFMRGSTTLYLYIYIGNDTFVNLNGSNVFGTNSVAARFQYAPASTWKYLAVLRPSIVLESI